MTRRILAALRRALHQHWPANPTGRPGFQLEVCRCGDARYVHLDPCSRALWSSSWTRDPLTRRIELDRYSAEAVHWTTGGHR